MKKLLDLPHIEIDSVNNQGKTPLHLGCAHNRGTIVFYLLAHHANMLAVDNRNMTPLHEVAYRNHISLYQELVQDYCTTKGILKEIAAMQDDLENIPENYINASNSTIKPIDDKQEYPPYPPNSPSNASTTSKMSRVTQQQPVVPVAEPPQPQNSKPKGKK